MVEVPTLEEFDELAANVAQPAPWVGAAVAPAAGSSDYQAPWDALDTTAGPLWCARTFDSTIKPVGSERWRKIAGPAPFYSVKPPGGDVAGFIDGVYTAQFQEMALALPNGSRLAVYHEPEDNLSGVTFAALTARAVADLRDVRPVEEVEFWYVAMGYQYETNSKGQTLTPQVEMQPGWVDAARTVDCVGLDEYASGPNDFHPLRTSLGVQRWLDLIVAEAGKPWGIVERGISAHAGPAARIKMLFDDWRFVNEYGGGLFLYWQAQLQGYSYPLTDPAELAAFGRLAAAGRQR